MALVKDKRLSSDFPRGSGGKKGTINGNNSDRPEAGSKSTDGTNKDKKKNGS